MTWNSRQLATLAAEYERIGFRTGDRWPAPPEHLGPDDILAVLQRIPNGAGRDGYVAALATLSPS